MHADRGPIPVPHGIELYLVAVSQRRSDVHARSDERLRALGIHTPDAGERVDDEGTFRLELEGALDMRPRAAAADPCEGAGRPDAPIRWPDDLEDAPARVAVFLLDDPDAHGISGDAARDEQRLSLGRARDGIGTVAQALDFDFVCCRTGFHAAPQGFTVSSASCSLMNIVSTFSPKVKRWSILSAIW